MYRAKDDGDSMENDIRQGLNLLEEYAEIISTASAYLKEEFENSPLIYGGAERYILLGLGQIFKVCKLVIGKYYSEKSYEVSKYIKILEKHKILPPWLAIRLTDKVECISFFSQEDCLKDINKAQVYNWLDEIVSDFKHFKKYVLEYIN
ncbi:hypothetical protein [Petroclostridium xylanilyticum]|uniref:hypothetical protein n=1 Tax=Petroclostridium xylanilyticum TaxID=1792311 RepID=UPI0012FFA561|nr:hypothetical protein [Petroclostridium xylanilyticum]